MRILITNDDGIHAEGLDICEKIARSLSDDVWVVAPEYDQSGIAHSDSSLHLPRAKSRMMESKMLTWLRMYKKEVLVPPVTRAGSSLTRRRLDDRVFAGSRSER